jgi:hypothetical protein
MRRVIVAAFLAVNVVQAAPAGAQTVTVVVIPRIEVAASRTGTVLQHNDSSGHPIWCGLQRGGRAILAGITERTGFGGTEIAVGVRRHRDPGTLPFPCPEIWSTFATGRVAFDLPRRTNVSLVWARLRVVEVDREAELRTPRRCNSVVGAIGPMTEGWLPGLFNGNARAGVPVATVLPQPARMTSLREIDVTDMAQRWFEGSMPNNGLALIGVQDQVRDRNMVCAAFLRARLIVQLQGGCPAGSMRAGRRCF